MQKFAIIASLVVAALVSVAKSAPPPRPVRIPPTPAHLIQQPAAPAAQAPPAPAQDQEAINALFDGGGIPQSAVPAYGKTQEGMLDYSNYVCDLHRIANRPASPELMAAAQAHADFLADRGYGAYFGRSLPNAHDGWGDGTPRTTWGCLATLAYRQRRSHNRRSPSPTSKPFSPATVQAAGVFDSFAAGSFFTRH